MSISNNRPQLSFEILQPESCESCGLCCEKIGSPVLLFASRPEIQGPHPFRPPGLPEELIVEIDNHFGNLRRGEEPQERCFWFDPQTRRCKHYEWRPGICDEYELGGEGCLIERRDYLVDPQELP